MTESSNDHRDFHPDLPVFDKQWTGVPTFFIDELMRHGKGIPAAFWKLTFVVWRRAVAPSGKIDGQWQFDYTCKTTESKLHSEYNINKAAVADWTRAYSVSGLFSIKKGKRHVKDQPGTPTIWYYNKSATIKDWAAFILALSEVCRGADGMHRPARRGKYDDGEKSISASGAFLLRLALAVDKKRETINGILPGLPPVNTRRIQKLLESGYGTREPDGTITYEYVVPGNKFKRLEQLEDFLE